MPATIQPSTHLYRMVGSTCSICIMVHVCRPRSCDGGCAARYVMVNIAFYGTVVEARYVKLTMLPCYASYASYGTVVENIMDIRQCLASCCTINDFDAQDARDARDARDDLVVVFVNARTTHSNTCARCVLMAVFTSHQGCDQPTTNQTSEFFHPPHTPPHTPPPWSVHA